MILWEWIVYVDDEDDANDDDDGGDDGGGSSGGVGGGDDADWGRAFSPSGSGCPVREARRGDVRGPAMGHTVCHSGGARRNMAVLLRKLWMIRNE